MDYQVNINVKEIAEFLGAPYIGQDFLIHTVCSIQAPKKHALGFIQRTYTKELANLPILWLSLQEPTLPRSFAGAYLLVENPRLAYAQVVQKFWVKKAQSTIIAESAKLGSNLNIGNNVVIGEGTVIGDHVTIGDDTIINHNVVIADNTVIGKGCYIKSGAVIGEEGFGFAFEGKRAIRIPHLGRVILGDFVEIGANTTVARGTIEDTQIDDYVKIDDQVIIAHNCEVGENTLITGFASLGGSAKIGKNCYLAPHSSTLPKIEIAEGATIGIGTVVLKDVNAHAKIMDVRKKIDLNEGH